ncbi:MAG: HAD family hydrolase [Patescibacteria group bacterium]|nr:HAD hydrolase-like protein [Patescibacteria group bacterium]MDE1940996.1 HAD family hydrolase [Patescibacteria group bacterium]MDE1966685.1 HAD family hydrolase [Patescibacteria group bacterium]
MKNDLNGWPPKRQKMVILDFDGTLVQMRITYLAMTSIFMMSGRPMPSYMEFARDFHPPYKLFYEARGVFMPKEEIRAWYDMFKSHQISSFFPDVRQELKRLSEEAIVCILSANKESLVRSRCEIHGLARNISQFIGDSLDKTDPMKKLCRAYGVDLDQATYLGDFADDMVRARLAGVNAVGITRGRPTRQVLLDAGAHIVIDQLSELKVGI